MKNFIICGIYNGSFFPHNDTEITIHWDYSVVENVQDYCNGQKALFVLKYNIVLVLFILYFWTF